MASLLTRNPAVLRMALCAAAEERWKEEVVDTDMVDLTIGQDGEFDTKEDWFHDKINEWIEGAAKSLADIGHELGFDQETALRYMSMKVGEQTVISNDVRVTRVPGGWVWLFHSRDVATSTFIPYTDVA